MPIMCAQKKKKKKKRTRSEQCTSCKFDLGLRATVDWRLKTTEAIQQYVWSEKRCACAWPNENDIYVHRYTLWQMRHDLMGVTHASVWYHTSHSQSAAIHSRCSHTAHCTGHHMPCQCSCVCVCHLPRQHVNERKLEENIMTAGNILITNAFENFARHTRLARRWIERNRMNGAHRALEITDGTSGWFYPIWLFFFSMHGIQSLVANDGRDRSKYVGNNNKMVHSLARLASAVMSRI